MLSEGATEVGTVGIWLRHDLVERLAGSLPIGTLDAEERSEGQSSRKSEDEVLGLSAKNRSQKRVSERPSGENVDCSLGAQFLELMSIELLHLNNFPFRKVVIL